MNTYFVEYIWTGGNGEFRSKCKILTVPENTYPETITEDLLSLEWNYDGSSTGQATTEHSQCKLTPVRVYIDTSDTSHLYVLCATPERDKLTSYADSLSSLEIWVGFEQEFFIWDLATRRALGVCEGIPEQGPYYCGVEAVPGYNANTSKLRNLTERIAKRCTELGVELTGYNLEVAPGQTEIQVMSRSGLKACDDLMMMRFLAHRVLMEEHCAPVFNPKPLGSQWNGTGLHTNISTVATRTIGGIDAIYYYMDKLKAMHEAHIAVYGEGNAERLTGVHETSSMSEFTWSIGGRHTSVRIPLEVATAGRGYFEDRRPAGNANPYCVLARMVATFNGRSF